MSLSHRLFKLCVGFVTLFMLGGLYAPQEARGQAFGFPDGAIDLMVPQFVAEAVGFKAINESGSDWLGSDEVYAVFSDLNPNLFDLITLTSDDVDTGETRSFGPDERCIAPRPQCDRGVSEMLRFEVSFWERDEMPFEFCYGKAPGDHYILRHGQCNFDDLIGREQILMSREQLLVALPRVGDSVEHKLILGGPCGPSDDVCGGPPFLGPEYEFTYRITRLPDVKRPLVIAPPP